MKTLFLSDTQLGAGQQFGTGEYSDGSRLEDQRAVLQRTVALAHEQAVDAVIHLGDVFERSTPPPWQALVFQEFIRELRLPVLVLQGNHDVRSPALPSVIRLFDGEARVVTLPEVLPLDDCVFACLPWAPTARLAAGGGSREEVNVLATDALVHAAQIMRARCESEHPGLTPILIGHWAVSGSALPTGLPVAQLQEPVLPWDLLDDLGFKVAAFGHIHQPQLIAQGVARTPMFYCGSAMVSNWGEAGFAHGIWIYDSVEDDLAFHQIEDRKFVTTEFVDAIDMPDLTDAIVRVSYSTTADDPIDEAIMRSNLISAGAFRVFIKGTVERSSRARVEMPDEDVDPLAAFDLWIAQNESLNGSADVLRSKHAHYLQEAK